MPEGLEAEIWRSACEPLVGRTIVGVDVDARVAPPDLAGVVGATIVAVRRRGKVVLIDVDHGIPTRGTDRSTVSATIGLHFGMTGRLVVDGTAPIERLTYASGRDDAEWDRLRMWASPRPGVDHERVPALRFNDPRRLGHVSLDPDLDHLGVDFSAVTARRLAAALHRRRSTLKAALLDQRVVAGLGNLCADEVLWWSGIDPHRSTDALLGDDTARLARAIRTRLPVMLRRGGSTTGVLDPEVRAQCPPCERDGTPLRRDTIAGRTAVWCPTHQR
jgi:formamidopyrimidine-DNA glycosylase